MKDQSRPYKVGRHTYGAPRVQWDAQAPLEIGSFCSIATGVTIMCGGEHPTNWVSTYPFAGFWPSVKGVKGMPYTKGPVIIGNDVWIGTGALILSGVTIGDGAVIGARAVVAKNIPPYAIAAGNPARVIRMRFDESTVARLLKIKWWDWDDKKIARYAGLMSCTDINAFLDAAEKGTL